MRHNFKPGTVKKNESTIGPPAGIRQNNIHKLPLFCFWFDQSQPMSCFPRYALEMNK